MQQVPMPIPTLILETIRDETGFTMTEKVALRNAWKLVAPDMREHAVNHFLTFFTEHHQMLERFRCKNGKFNLQTICKHPQAMFLKYEAMIFDGLEGEAQMHGVISPFVAKHLQVEDSEISAMVKALGDYLKLVLKRFLSPTLGNSIDKLSELLLKSHQIS